MPHEPNDNQQFPVDPELDMEPKVGGTIAPPDPKLDGSIVREPNVSDRAYSDPE